LMPDLMLNTISVRAGSPSVGIAFAIYRR